MKQIKTDPTKTVLVITIGMLIIFYVTKWQWAIKVSIIIGLLGLLSNYVAAKINYLWMKLSWILSLIVPNILLSIVFFFILTPIAFLAKIFSEKNPLQLKNTSKSMFEESNKAFGKASFENPW